jgi:hypothetical protein
MGTGDPLSLVLMGDAILNRPLRMDDPGFEGVREIVASADASFTNMEMVHPSVPFTPSLVYQGHNASAPPEMVGEPLRFGFNLFSFANNRAADFGGKGIQGPQVRATRTQGLLLSSSIRCDFRPWPG